jgi:hypothetical protein
MKPYDETEEIAESDVILTDINKTRESMDQTLDRIGERIKPRHLLDDFLELFRSNGDKAGAIREKTANVLHSAGDAAGRAAHAVADVVRQHPIPVLLIGAGVGYAIYETRRGRRHDTGWRGDQGEAEWSQSVHEPAQCTDEVESAAEAGSTEGGESAKEKIKGTIAAAGEQLQEQGRKIRDRASEGARAIGRKAHQLKDEVAHSAQRGYEVGRAKFSEASQAHPLSVGLGFLAVGVLAGLAVPATRAEDEWAGEASDRVKQRAKAKGQDLLQRGKRVAEATVDVAKKTAAEEGLTPQAIKDKLSHVAAEARQTTEDTAGQEGLKPT